MEHITVSDVWGFLSPILVGITIIGAALRDIIAGIKAARTPEQKQNERIDNLEADVRDLKRHAKETDDKLESDNQKLGIYLEAIQVIQESVLAMLNHTLNEKDNPAQMEDARDKLQSFLISHSGTKLK